MRWTLVIASILAACEPATVSPNDDLERRLEQAEDRLRELEETLTAAQDDLGDLRERVAQLNDERGGAAGLEGVRCEDGTCHVERSSLDALLDEPERMTGLARVTPARDGSKTIGFTLAEIREDSLLHALGFRNADVLTQLNGRALDSMDAAMGSLTTVRTAEVLTVELLRGGESITIEIVLDGS